MVGFEIGRIQRQRDQPVSVALQSCIFLSSCLYVHLQRPSVVVDWISNQWSGSLITARETFFCRPYRTANRLRYFLVRHSS